MFELLSRFIPEGRIFKNEPMAEHTSINIGGPADVYVQPANRTELLRVIEECKRAGAPFVVLGGAANVLVPDEGLRMVVIQLHPYYRECLLIDGTRLKAEAGVLLSDLADLAWLEGLTGLEFASGIPGTVGGAVCMNAGAYGGEIADVCVSVDILTADGSVAVIPKEEMAFGYRSSLVQEEFGAIVLAAEFALSPDDRDAIRARMNELNSRRQESQPQLSTEPSVGSTFKRPEGHYAGKLITDAGLKGYKIGGAMVSMKHAGFVVNTGGATAADVLALMRHIQATVREQYGVELEPEVKILCNL